VTSNPVVTVIPATIHLSQKFGQTATRKKRVAAYARVSTDLAEQLNSYEAQVDFYTNHIKSNADWEFVAVYCDEGISATNTKKRDGFNRMVADALAGKIDMIITKSVSRFARNTVDSLQTIRDLKAAGVEVFFEKENIRTFDGKGELLLTIMSSLAQEESRSISENVTWGKRKSMQDGKVSLPYKRFLGYEKGSDGKPQIVESEAKTVRRIYDLFLAGSTYREIGAGLTADGIPTPGGKTVWSMTSVRSILQNEKYAGNAILQKKYTVDFLSKKQKINQGEMPQYYVENSHPGIVSRSAFELVQDEIRRRKQFGKQISGSGLFSGRIICGECADTLRRAWEKCPTGTFRSPLYGPKVWNSGSKYRSVVWRCNNRYRQKGAVNCRTPHLSEVDIQVAFTRAWAALLADKGRYIAEYEAEINSLSGFAELENQTVILAAECAEAAGLVEDCIAANAANALDQDAYQKRYDGLVAKYDFAKNRLDALNREKLERVARRERIGRFLGVLRGVENLPSGFDEGLWRETVEAVIIHSLGEINIKFFSGTEIWVSVENV